jgi:hypothetical protein
LSAFEADGVGGHGESGGSGQRLRQARISTT